RLVLPKLGQGQAHEARLDLGGQVLAIEQDAKCRLHSTFPISSPTLLATSPAICSMSVMPEMSAMSEKPPMSPRSSSIDNLLSSVRSSLMVKSMRLACPLRS